MIGAWSLSGALLDRERDLRPLLAHGADPKISTARLWLSSENLAHDGDRVAAFVGFATGGLKGLLAGETPEGGFVAVRGEGEGSLTLLRGPSGGERLYVAQQGEVAYFASSVRPLLALVGQRLNTAVLDEALLTGQTMLGGDTLHEGISEVLAGHHLVLSDRVGDQVFTQPEILRSPVGSVESLARAFRDRLTEAVVLAAGPERPVAIALSGGIDSSAVAAAAVDAFGAENVVAYTYEFEDPTHGTELHYARQVAIRLGIKNHHVFQLTAKDYLAAIPEMIWRSESVVHWPKAFMLLVARHLRSRGHDRYLTGFGIGSHTAWLRDLAGLLHHAPASAVLAHWKPLAFRSARPSLTRLADRISQLHPGLEQPHPRLYYVVLRILEHAGRIKDLPSFFPAAMAPFLERRRPFEALEPSLEGLPLVDQLLRVTFGHMVSCVDVTRSERASRELGVLRLAPAHFASVIPYAYQPVEPAPRLWTQDRALRPGKLLLRHAFADALPDGVLYRIKNWDDAVASPSWLTAARRKMLSTLPGFPRDAERYGPGYADAIRYWEPRSTLASGLSLRLWERMFVELPVTSEPPTWSTLHPTRAPSPLVPT
ncbi:MAG: 7-cyano-7-deazaguanine synthase [Planctomycetes bacterium]|nr:7-cyano-7-deazaguanine synthase [Planctomycetota bacterium]